jgi:prepilin-type N-terminal cleavage/methylation domain-containing protein
MRKQGFTLIEVLVAIVLIGLAIASLVAANYSFTRANAAGVNLSTAEFLIEQIRELMAPLAVVDPNTGISVFGPEPEEGSLADYDDLDDFDDVSFCPPINAARETLSDYANYSQRIMVENVSASDFEQVVGSHMSDFVRVTVDILVNSEQINSVSWVRAEYEQP